MAEDFMQNRAATIEPVNFGVQDALSGVPKSLAEAYEYITNLQKQMRERLTAPARAAFGAVGEARARGQDFLANQALSLIDTKRANPDAFLMEAQDNAAPAYESFSQIGKGASSLGASTMDAIENARKELIQKAGLIDTRNSTPTPPQTRPTTPADVRAMADVGQTTGALPSAQRRVIAPRTPGGALPTAGTPFPGAQESDINMPSAPAPIPAAPVAATPQKGLREQYLERIANMDKKAPAGMTDEQKGQALMEAGLAIMASASRPGASALGAVGEGGLKGTAVAREMERINRAEADKLRTEGRADVRTEFDLAGRDEDRAIRKEDKAEERRIKELDVSERSADRKENAKINARKIDLLERQLEEGRTKVIDDGGTGTYSLLNTVTGAVTPTKAKVKPAKDDTPAEIRLLQALRKDPGLLETYKEIKGEKGGISDKDIIAQAVELTKGQTALGGTENPEAVLQRNIDAVKRAAGRPGAVPSRESQAAAIRDQFRQKQITKEQAVQQLQKLGYQ